MPSRSELLALSTLLLQAIAHPAPGGGLGYPDGSGNLELLFSQAFDYKPTQSVQKFSEQFSDGGDPGDYCGGGAGGHGGGGHEGGGGGSGYPGPTITVTGDW